MSKRVQRTSPKAAAGLPIVEGDLWDFHETGHRIVLTTNIGWDPETMRNNMGAGVAQQAAHRWPDLPVWYGKQCSIHRDRLGVVQHVVRRLIFLPVKPLLDPKYPERSWDQTAKLKTIVDGLIYLAEMHLAHNGKAIALSFPGCGNGGLREAQVLPHMISQLPHDGSIVVVRYKPSEPRNYLGP